MSEFHGYPTESLENEFLRLEYLSTIGPRIARLSFERGENLLGDVPDIAWETPIGKYYVHGGHRLWIAPEIPEKTYIPDGPGLEVKKIPGGVELTGPVEVNAGVRKTMRIELAEKQPVVRILHTIKNESEHAVNCAPWVITMFKQGGTAILPQPVGNADPHGLLHNRIMVIWPYTRLTDPRLTLRDDFILLQARPALPPVKLGFFDKAGWLAYWIDGVLFKKTFELPAGAAYPDAGCNAETYCNDRFVELESLGPLANLQAGASIQWTEVWEFFTGLDVDFLPVELQTLIKKLE